MHFLLDYTSAWILSLWVKLVAHYKARPWLIISTKVLIRHLWQLMAVVFPHTCLICATLLNSYLTFFQCSTLISLHLQWSTLMKTICVRLQPQIEVTILTNIEAHGNRTRITTSKSLEGKYSNNFL